MSKTKVKKPSVIANACTTVEKSSKKEIGELLSTVASIVLEATELESQGKIDAAGERYFDAKKVLEKKLYQIRPPLPITHTGDIDREVITEPPPEAVLLSADWPEELKRYKLVSVVDISKFAFEKESIWDIKVGASIQRVCLDVFMEHVWKILRNDGTITVRAPYLTSFKAWQTADNINKISEYTFAYYNKQSWENVNKGIKYPHDFSFDILATKYYLMPGQAVLSDAAQLYQRLHMWNVVDSIEVTLRKSNNF